MDLLKQYREGDTIRVYEEIRRLGPAAFESQNLKEVNAVLKETMNRVAHNLGIIYSALQELNYCFNKNPKYDFQHPLLRPRWDDRFRVGRLERLVRSFGHIPLSLKMFYRIVGSCNFAWDYETDPDILWEGGDPIQIGAIKDILRELSDLEDDEEGFELQLSADHYHKDNISGGPAYSIELTPDRQVDSLFLNEEHETTFVNYLRIVMENCGFSRAYAIDDPGFSAYCRKVRSLLKPI